MLALVAVMVLAVTVIGPVVAPLGTVAVSELPLAAVTVAAVPLNFTAFADGVAPKPDPLITTLVPAGPEAGVKLVIVGVAATRYVPEAVTTGPPCTDTVIE